MNNTNTEAPQSMRYAANELTRLFGNAEKTSLGFTRWSRASKCQVRALWMKFGLDSQSIIVKLQNNTVKDLLGE